MGQIERYEDPSHLIDGLGSCIHPIKHLGYKRPQIMLNCYLQTKMNLNALLVLIVATIRVSVNAHPGGLGIASGVLSAVSSGLSAGEKEAKAPSPPPPAPAPGPAPAPAPKKN